jgi:hypothetical protein
MALEQSLRVLGLQAAAFLGYTKYPLRFLDGKIRRVRLKACYLLVSELLFSRSNEEISKGQAATAM